MAACDMLVKLYDLKPHPELDARLDRAGITIRRPLAVDSARVEQFVTENFSEGWRNECRAALSTVPAHCFVAVKEHEIIGFACYDATARNFFGPTGVRESERGHGVGSALLFRCMEQMYADGFAYAVIGWVGDARPFYEKVLGAIAIPDSHPGIYGQLVRY